MKHGFRAETILLPNENLDDLQACFDHWTDFYRPDTPGEAFLIDRAVYYAIQLGRCAVHQAALASQQIRHALHDDEILRRTAIEPHKALLLIDPIAAYERLHHTATGCQWLMRSFDDMALILRAGRCWSEAEQQLAVRLTGVNPMKQGVEDSGLGQVLAAHRELVESGDFETEENTAEWAELRGELLRELEEEIAAIVPLEAELAAIEERDRAEVVARSLLADGPKAALYQRYERMYELGFQRVYKEILKAIQLAEKAEKDGDRDEESESESAGGSGAPNEANEGREERLSSSESKTSESGSGRNMTVVGDESVPESMVSGDADGSGRVGEDPGAVSAG
jgi:hypothetical protein